MQENELEGAWDRLNKHMKFETGKHEGDMQTIYLI